MKERILFVGVGQAGGNICELLKEKQYNTLAINTSNDDLETLTINHKYHIPYSKGCSKDRQLALQYAKNYHSIITDIIDNNYQLNDIVFFVFSLGGGSGAGLSPIFLDILSNKNPNKNYGAIIILPSVTESIKTQINAVETYNQVINIPQLKNIFVLDNNNTDKFEVNTKFVEMFDNLINITIPNTKGIIDKAELETLLTTKGNSYMSFDIQSLLNQQQDNSVFTPYEYGCKYIGISLNDNINTEILEKSIGVPYDTFTGYNDERDFIIVAGSPFPQQRIRQLVSSINVKQNDLTKINESTNLNIPKSKNEISQKQVKPLIPINFDALFAKYMD